MMSFISLAIEMVFILTVLDQVQSFQPFGALIKFHTYLYSHATDRSILAYAAAVAHAYSCHNLFL